MLKATATILIAGTLTIVAATQAQEVLDLFAPTASTNVSDTNLRIVYREALLLAYMDGSSVVETLPIVAQDHETPGLRYTVSADGTLVRAETDWSCRVAEIEDTWVRISDC